MAAEEERERGRAVRLRQFVREERLDGDNKWNTQDATHGKQDARRSTRFRRLPPVLQLHLKRFECAHATATPNERSSALVNRVLTDPVALPLPSLRLPFVSVCARAGTT